MGKIELIGKWDEEKKYFRKEALKEELSRSFAIGNYEDIINNDEGINYIVIAHGSRVEDHSRDFEIIKEKRLGVTQILEHYGRKNENYAIKTYLMDGDAPVVESSKAFAEYLENLAKDYKTKSIHVMGLSKCGCLCFYVPSFFRNSESFKKINIYNVATPYTGAELASPLIFYPKVEKFIKGKFGDNIFSEKIYQALIDFYESVSSNSHMDYDIAVLDGVYPKWQDKYDRSFIAEIFRDENVEAIKKINSFINLTTGIDEDTLGKAILSGNLVGVGLCVLDTVFFEKKSDGMVFREAQREVDKYLDSKHVALTSAHHDVNSQKDILKKILGVIDEQMLEDEETKAFQKKKSIF